MMGIKVRACGPLPPMTREDLVPADHVSRHLARTRALGVVRDSVHDAYADTGRPAIDPVVFFTRQLIFFFEGLCTERQLMPVVADRLSLRWYLGYDLGEQHPDHSSLTRIRDRLGLKICRRFFAVMVEQCWQAGLVWGQERSVDATKVEAHAALAAVKPRFAGEAHVSALFAATDAAEDGDREAAGESPALLPVELTPEAQAALAEAAAHRLAWIGAAGRPDRRVGRGATNA